MSLTTWVSSQLDRWLSPTRQKEHADEQESGTRPPEEEHPSPALPDEQPASTLPVPASASVPLPPEVKDATIVSGQFIPNGTGSSTIQIMTDARRNTEHFRKVVESFDEDKQTPLEWAIGKLALTVSYVSPFVVAFFIGMGVGDKFAENQTSWWMQIGIHVLSLFLELLMPILGLATTITFKKALKDRSAIPGFLVVGAFFLAVSIANSFALLMLLENGFTLSLENLGASVAVLGRSFGPLILDVGAAIYISVSTVRSLKKYLADKRQKILAIREVNAVEIEMDQTNQRAEMDRIQARAEMESRQQRMSTLNEAERLTHEAVITSMKKKLMSDNDNDSRGRSRYSSW